MVYNTQHWWAFGLCPLSCIPKNTKEHNRPNRVVVFPPHVRTEMDSVSETLIFLEHKMMDKSPTTQ
jgi:hypothetical protein